MKNIDKLLEEAEIAEEKARLANLKYQSLVNKKQLLESKNILTNINTANKVVNQKLLDLEKIFDIKINDYNKNKSLIELGFDSMKIVEISEEIENILNIKLNLSSLFRLKLNDFKELTSPETPAYQEVINKIKEIKNNIEIDSDYNPMEIRDNAGYCGLMLYYNIINVDEYKKIKNYQTRIYKGELGCQAIYELNRIIEMSRSCVKKLKGKDKDINYLKKEFEIFKNNFEESIDKIHLSWCQFNSKIITYLDPKLEEIPIDINDLNVVLKFTT